MDIRQLKYFVSVAKYLNFTEAAKHHYIAQSAISQQIGELEKQIGVKLFNRNNRSVQLTTAGAVFLQDAEFLISKATEAAHKARHAASGFVGRIKIGLLGPSEKKFLPQVIRKYHHNYPKIDISLVQTSAGQLREALERGELDVAFTMPYDLAGGSELTWKLIYNDPASLTLHRSHRLANETRVNLADLANERFIAIEREEAPGVHDLMMHHCARNGFSPNIVGRFRSLETGIMMVESGIGIALLSNCFRTYANSSVCFVDLEGKYSIEIVVAWNKSNDNPSVPLFLREFGVTKGI